MEATEIADAPNKDTKPRPGTEGNSGLLPSYSVDKAVWLDRSAGVARIGSAN